MEILIIIIIISIVSAISFYSQVIKTFHDLELPDLDTNIFSEKSVLFIYPHPDDETMISGGLIHKLAERKDVAVHVVSLTRGEKGNELRPDLTEGELGQVRIKEFNRAMKALGIRSYEMFNLGDGTFNKQESEVKDMVKELVNKYHADWVVTYERSGLYGHSDHVVLSKVVHELSEETGFNTMYATVPEKIEKKANISSHIRSDVEISEADWCQKPEYKVNIAGSMFAKLRGGYQYKSQRLSHERPLWVSVFFMPFEYYTTTYGGHSDS